jgi:DNA invertase Pin-like site-specific DNA recombinase
VTVGGIAADRAVPDDCQCGRGPVVGLLTFTNSRVLFRAANEGTPLHDQNSADLRCLDCVADAVAEVASGDVRERMRQAARDARQMVVYEVVAYRGNRNWHLKIADYRKTVRDAPGKPPAREQAEALRAELADRSHRNRFGWTHIDIQSKNEDVS